MKKIVLFLNIVLLAIAGNAQTGINTIIPGTSSVLEVNSLFSDGTYGGFMPPRITQAQRNTMAMTLANDGLIAYVTFPDGTRCLQVYNGATSTWKSIKCLDPIVAWSESLGTPGSSTSVNTYTGYDNYATATYNSSSSTPPQVKIVAPLSSTITGGSGGGYLFFTQASDRQLIISGINVTSYAAPLALKLLIFKESTPSVAAAQSATGSELIIDYYNSATTSWSTAVTVTDLPTGTGTQDTWYERTLSTTVPNTITQIRFTRTTAGGGPVYRIDDIKIIKL